MDLSDPVLLPVSVSENCWMSGKQYRSNQMLQNVASDLGLHDLLCPNI